MFLSRFSISALTATNQFEGWLFQVAHNLALKHRQKKLRRLQTESDWDATLPNA